MSSRWAVSPTTWLKTDDKFPEHRKVRRLSDSAYRLHHTAMCACAKDETDGYVTAEDVADMEHGNRLRKHIDALVAADLWEEASGGWWIHDYLDYNPSHASLVAKRAVDKARQEKYRKGRVAETTLSERQADHGVPVDNSPATSRRNGSVHELPSEEQVSQRDNHVTTALSQPPVPVPSRPVPVPDPSSIEKHSPRGSRMTTEWKPSEKCHETVGAEFVDLDLSLQLDSFRDYWISRGETRKDWDAAFRNWCRKAREFNHKPTNGARRTNGLTDDEWQAAFVRAQAADLATGDLT